MNCISVSNKMLFNFVFSFYDVTHPPLPAPVIFPNKCLSKKKVESWFFVNSNITISDIFSENFIEIL